VVNKMQINVGVSVEYMLRRLGLAYG